MRHPTPTSPSISNKQRRTWPWVALDGYPYLVSKSLYRNMDLGFIGGAFLSPFFFPSGPSIIHSTIFLSSLSALKCRGE